MPHNVIITEEAESNLEAIGDYIALDNPEKAKETVDRILSHIEALADFPRRYRVREDLGRDRRMLIVGNYLVVYRIEGDTVYVQRVCEGSRDIRRLFEGDDRPPE